MPSFRGFQTALRFVIVGGTGALLSLGITWVLTTFVFGIGRYWDAYLIGIAANLLFNFALYTTAVFKTKRDHFRRLAIFLFYGVIMAALQGTTVKLLVAHLGAAWYLEVIAATIAVFAVLNYFVFKLSIFKEHEGTERASSKAILAFIIVCAVLLRLAVLFHVLADAGVTPLVYGDAVGYRELAGNLIAGNGFVASTYGYPRPEVFRTPGLPLLIAPFAPSDNGLALYLFLLAILSGILLPLFTFLVSKRMLPATGALAVAALTAFEPHLVFFSMLPLTEMPFMLFGYGGFAVALHAIERRSLLFASFAGALFGYAILIRPGFLPVLAGALLLALAYSLWRVRMHALPIIATLLTVFVVLSPWYVRTHEITGVYALSGAGWRNVYTDYLASVRAVDNHTDFSSEKTNLKLQSDQAGVAQTEVNNPANAAKLKTFSLHELWQRKATVAKLETTLLVSYFLQDGYYYEFRRYLLVPDDTGTMHISPTFTLLTKGAAGIPDILEEASRQLFIPVIGRIFTIGVFLCAIIGFFTMKSRVRYLLAFVIALSALTATAIGLGVESRLRLPIEPLLFIFFSAAYVRFLLPLHTHEN